jgi:hypothetical protein
MKIIELLNSVDMLAREFLKVPYFPDIDIKEREAVLVGFVNFLGLVYYVGYGMYTTDLRTEVDFINHIKCLQENCKEDILKMLRDQAVMYIRISPAFIKNSKHMNEIEGDLVINPTEIQMLMTSFVDYIERKSK